MVDWKKLAKKANDVVQQRGGAKSVEEDAAELVDIAGGEGTLSEKAKRAAQALKEPGAHQPAPAAAHQPAPPAVDQPAPPAVDQPAPAARPDEKS